ncbi:MAG: FAD-linked oxidase C-terminal domain-containing protein [Phycisphaerales bacterium]|nr:FAD-linked oxidase C-terminal domain-containing protein [Phycisphaerales bacterium]
MKIYNKVDAHTIGLLKQVLGEEWVMDDKEDMEKYSRDDTEKLVFFPEVVVKPITPEEVSAIFKIANQYQIPVTPRGAGTGLSGGALPIAGGIVLSTERMNQILFIDEKNFQVTTQPGVITEVLMNQVKEKGLFYPPDPSSKGSCFIGGNISENSGGPKAVKYGVVKDYVLNLEVVLPTGEIIWTGANTLKNSTGYNLTQLIVGSEGTLCVVTKIVLKLIPLPKYDMTILAPFSSIEKAGACVNEVFMAGYTPSALELIDADSIKFVAPIIQDHVMPLSPEIQAYLLIEVDGQNKDVLFQELESIAQITTRFGAGDVLFAEDSHQKEVLWKVRRKLGEVLKSNGFTIEEDTVVPRAELPKLIKAAKDIGKKFDCQVLSYGHAGDGNLHIRIRKEGISGTYNNVVMKKIIRELFIVVKNLGGTISGEHGIGLIQKDFLDIVFDATTIELMRQIKKVFDPNLILNPNKIFDC